MRRAMILVYGGVAYLLFLLTFLYTIGFLADLPKLKTVDSGPARGLAVAMIVDLALLGLFAVQHSVMARQGFKRWWTQVVPQPAERSTYVLAASAVVALLIWQWRPINETVWTFNNPAGWWLLTAVFWLSWAILLLSTFLIGHFSLFGLQQAYFEWRGQPDPAPTFKTPGFYRFVRHPIYCGFIGAFWATPRMTVGRLLFALAATGYILIGASLEERDLVAQFGDLYRRYQRQVPMLVPRLTLRRRSTAGSTSTTYASSAAQKR
jgi:methanethiol S-methyltransferase